MSIPGETIAWTKSMRAWKGHGRCKADDDQVMVYLWSEAESHDFFFFEQGSGIRNISLAVCAQWIGTGRVRGD